jgi:dephospho-CoA kinase
VKLFVVGHGRHGKDTVAEFIQKNYGLTFESSSMFCAEHVVTPWLEKLGITYDSLEACYEDRVNHRQDWYEAIRAYNKEDESKLSRAIFAKYDMYVGIRSRVEFLEARHFSDLSIWVEASDRWPDIDPTCKILQEDCDVIIDNNGTIEELYVKLTRLFDLMSSRIASKP